MSVGPLTFGVLTTYSFALLIGPQFLLILYTVQISSTANFGKFLARKNILYPGTRKQEGRAFTMAVFTMAVQVFLTIKVATVCGE